MKTAKIIHIFLIAISFFVSIHCSQNHDIEFKKQVTIGCPIPDGVMDTLMEIHDVPGVSIAVIQNGQIDWVKGYGVREYGKPEPVDSTTLFQAASISKPVSAVVALQMVNSSQVHKNYE
ncbi:MAG: class A beta-lactamase-related serine hydrolase [Calditrichaeota bacterium]|nr:MAG: class A beta-lactamase-related serine hydrolase [Calditrichota bacterium]